MRSVFCNRGAPALGAVLVVAALATPPACATRRVREVVYSQRGTTTTLRGARSADGMLNRGFQHPLQISTGRLSEILKGVSVRNPGRADAGSRPAFAAEVRASIAKALSAGFAAAGPGQEIVVLVAGVQARSGIFPRDTLTSLIAYAKRDGLYLHLGHLDWPLPRPRPDPLPQPSLRRPSLDLELVLAADLEPVAPRGLRASRTPRASPRGMEPAEPTAAARDTAPSAATPEQTLPRPTPLHDAIRDLSSGTLRALAVLEEARRRGDLAEAEYRKLVDALLTSSSSPHPSGVEGGAGKGS